MQEITKFKSGKQTLTWSEGRTRECKKSVISAGLQMWKRRPEWLEFEQIHTNSGQGWLKPWFPDAWHHELKTHLLIFYFLWWIEKVSAASSLISGCALEPLGLLHWCPHQGPPVTLICQEEGSGHEQIVKVPRIILMCSRIENTNLGKLLV